MFLSPAKRNPAAFLREYRRRISSSCACSAELARSFGAARVRDLWVLPRVVVGQRPWRLFEKPRSHLDYRLARDLERQRGLH